MRNAGLGEAQAGIKIARRNINNLRYADDTTLTAESEEELKSLLMKVKDESEKVGLKFNTQKTQIMASGPITSWEIEGQGNTEVPGVSWEVPCSALKGETVLDTLDATAKVPRHAGFPRGEHRGSWHHFI